MFKRSYSIQAPGIMAWEQRKLTKKQVETLRKAGYTVER